MGNLDIWDKHATIPAKHVKEITGKQYKGNSPKPHYIIWCLTDMFGPLGKGFGWRVVAEDFTTLGDTTLHWCRIVFWWADADGKHETEAYGQTKAAYPSRNGVTVDEDAPKKSLTDAIVKAASQLGVAADIFLGRWDDNKFIADLKAEELAAAKPKTAESGPSATETEAAISMIEQMPDLPTLAKYWKGLAENAAHVAKDARVQAAKESRKAQLTPQEKAA